MCEMTRVSCRKIRVVVLAMREMHSPSAVVGALELEKKKLVFMDVHLQASSAAYMAECDLKSQ